MKQRPALLLGLLLGLSALFIALGVCIGSEGFENVFLPLRHGAEQEMLMAQQIVWQIRLPRSVGAWAAGALLGLAGALAQGLFRNPLADPYLLGSASGASLGVAALVTGVLWRVSGDGAMAVSAASSLLSGDWWVRLSLTGAAFVGSVLAVLLTLALAGGVANALRLLLSGVVVGVVLGAATSFLLLLSPQALQVMQSFMLGSTGFVGSTSCELMLSVWLVCAVLAWGLARLLDGLSLGEMTARSLGLPLSQTRVLLIAILALSTATAVAQTGLIAFVGLAAPHLVRSMTQVTHRWLIWLASLTGGVLLLGADLLARWVISPQELPLVVCSLLLGGCYLMWLMHRGQGRWGQGDHHG